MPFHRPRGRGAFTLIELLVVVAISALFSTLAITYSSIGRNDVALTVEEAKISQFILQAKQLSLATYTASGSTSCGFGMTFNLATSSVQPYQTYSIFSYDPGGSSCPQGGAIANISSDQEKEYTNGTWDVPVSEGVVLESQNNEDGLVTILFYPPDPKVFLLREGDINPAYSGVGGDCGNFDCDPNISYGSAKVYLQTIDGQNSDTFAIDSEGQVEFQ